MRSQIGIVVTAGLKLPRKFGIKEQYNPLHNGWPKASPRSAATELLQFVRCERTGLIMKYNPRLKALVISTKDLDQTYYLIMYALKQMRESAGLPLTKYDRDGCLSEHDHAAIAIVELGINLGIDFDVTPHNHNKIDLTDY